MKSVESVSYKLPPEAYFDQAWLDREKVNIFGKSWLFAGLVSELEKPGSYKTVQAGFDSLIVIRDKSGQVNAFHNTCRHRGSRLLSGSGKCGAIVCPYHRWAWSLDGSLRGIPQRDQFPKLEDAELRLHGASVATWMGLIFVNPDPTPEVTFEQWSAGLADELAIFKADQLTLLKQDSFCFDANWKLYIENHIDWLHLWYVHPESLSQLDHANGEIKHFGSSFCSYDPVKPDANMADFFPIPDIPHLADAAAKYSDVGAHFLFPNLPIFTGSNLFGVADLVPLAPDKTQMNITFLGIEGGDVDAALASFNRITKNEDAAIITSIQQVVRGSRFAVGPITHRYERAISCFHDHYLSMMDGVPDEKKLPPSRFDGVWKRESVALNGGQHVEFEDVFWLQTRGRFADLRWPTNPQTGDVTAFAGRNYWCKPELHFVHEIDLNHDAGADVGRVRFEGDVLIETGQTTFEGEQVEFEEVWSPVYRCVGGDSRTIYILESDYKGYVVNVGEHIIAMLETQGSFSAGLWTNHEKWIYHHETGRDLKLDDLLAKFQIDDLSPAWTTP